MARDFSLYITQSKKWFASPTLFYFISPSRLATQSDSRAGSLVSESLVSIHKSAAATAP
jgi:hypothetical protein